MRSIRNAPKRPANLSLNSKVLDMARDMGLNISQTVDGLLTAEVMRLYWARWNEENAEAIAHYNERIAREGCFSDRWRSFMREPGGTDADADADIDTGAPADAGQRAA